MFAVRFLQLAAQKPNCNSQNVKMFLPLFFLPVRALKGSKNRL